VDATAERLPFDSRAFDAAMAMVTVRQWPDPAVRRAQAAWGFVSPAAQERAVARLRADLDCGKWDEMYHDLRTRPQFDGALRVVVGQPAA
jgi:hypothetical protein